ncbi:MAG: hypothetical protein ACRDRK_05120 [Pseudonocardia sp.]
MTPRPVFGVPVCDASQLGGGAVRVQIADGRTVVVKTGQPSAVAAEAAGLRWIQVPDGAPVPDLLATERGHLITKLIPTGPPTKVAAAALGRGLATLHAAGAPAFGADSWRERVPLHQLFPLLVHVVLFGRGYTAQTVAAAHATLRLA